MFCKHCGRQIADDSLFCGYCGGKVEPIQPEMPVEEPAPAEEPAEPEMVEEPAAEPEILEEAAPAEEPAEPEMVEEPAAEPEILEEPAPVEEPAPAEKPASMAFSSDDGFVSAPSGFGFANGAPAPGVPAAAGFAAAPMAVEPAAEEPAPVEVAPVAEETPAEPAAAAEEVTAAEEYTAEAEVIAEEPAADGFTQAAPAAQGMPLDYNQTSGQWQTGAAETAAPYTMPQGDYMNAQAPRKTGSKKKIIIPIVIIAAIIVIGALVMALGGGGDKAERVPKDPAAYKENCMIVPYDDLFENLDKYAGEDIEVTGQIFHMKEEDGTLTFVVDTIYDDSMAMYFGGTVIVQCNPDEEGIPDDLESWKTVTVYGTVGEGLSEYESDYGDYSAPLIDAKFIDFKE